MHLVNAGVFIKNSAYATLLIKPYFFLEVLAWEAITQKEKMSYAIEETKLPL